MYRTGYEITNLQGKCGSCKHYKPLIKESRHLKMNVQYCRGDCMLITSKGKCGYKQRTDTCKKWEG